MLGAHRPRAASSATTCARQIKVLSDSNRLRLVEIMLRDGPKHVNELQAEVGLEQSLVSYHLRILREAGLVRVAIDGKSRLYSACTVGDGKTIDLGCCALAFDSLGRPPERSRRGRTRSPG